MRFRTNMTWGLGILVAVAVGGGAAADVVVDMPPPRAPVSGAAATMPSAEFQTQEAAPTVGQIALHRYARARGGPYDTYYEPRSAGYFGGYAGPYYPPVYYPLFSPWGNRFGCWGYSYSPFFTFSVTSITNAH